MMSANKNRKREGGELNNDPPKKAGVVPDSQYDVVLIVEGQRFYCLKKKLVESEFLKNMFSSDFKEKEAKEIELRILKRHTFQMFLDCIDGVNSVTDENIEEAMAMVDYLQVPKLEIHCLEHLSKRSELSLRDQFTLAENFHSEKLVHQIMASIKDSFEFNEVVPSDLDSLASNTKTIVLQKAFELLGHRKPAPPLLKPEEIFEHRVNEILDQVEVQNHHGQVLADQCNLLRSHVLAEKLINFEYAPIAQDIVNSDAEIKELMNKRRSAHDAVERNYYEAQIQLAKFKHLITKINDEPNIFDKQNLLNSLIIVLIHFPRAINRSKRNNVGAQELAVGSRPIDETYRQIVPLIERSLEAWVPTLENHSQWMKDIEITIAGIDTWQLENVPFPDGIRQISARANFTALDNFIRKIRNAYYHNLAQAEQQNDDQN